MRVAPCRRARCGQLQQVFEAVQILHEFYGFIDAEGPVAPGQAHAFMRLAVSHNKAFERAGGSCKFKHHQFIHLCERLDKCGRPRFYTTYMDESLNRVLGTITASVNALAYSRNALIKYLLLVCAE